MHGGAVTPGVVDNGFSPWEQWSLEEDVCFHGRVSECIEDGSLSKDGVAALVLQLLSKANNTTLALLKEARYVDSSRTYEVNAHALVLAQRHILAARNLLLKGHSGTVRYRFPLEPPGGKRMLRLYRRITHRCYEAVASLNIFYQKFETWLHGNDKKYCHVAQIIVLLSNALDAMMQYHASIYPDRYTVPAERGLDCALNRANSALRIVVNALHAFSVPEENAGIILSEKSVLLINAAVLVSTINLLDMAARYAFTAHKGGCGNYPLTHIRVIKRCCALRVQILRAKSEHYMRIAQKNGCTQEILTCETAIWALDNLYDAIDELSNGMSYRAGRSLYYTYEISMNIAECATVLTLLSLAYSKAGRKHSTMAETLERYNVIVKDMKLQCDRLGPCEQDSVTELHDMLSHIEFVRGGLVAIDKNQLLYTLWSSRLLDQAIKAIDSAFSTCESAIKRADSRTRTSCDSSRYVFNPFFNTLRSVLFRAGLLDSTFNVEIDSRALGALFLYRASDCLPLSERGANEEGGVWSRTWFKSPDASRQLRGLRSCGVCCRI